MTDTTPEAVNTTATITTPIVTDPAGQNTVSSPVVQNSTTAATGEPAKTETPAKAEGEGSGGQNPAPEDPNKNTNVPEWAQKRINELTLKRLAAERREAEEAEKRKTAEAKTAELLAQIAARNPEQVQNHTPSTQLTEEEIEKRAAQKAIQIANQESFNRACNSIVEHGEKEFKDWDNSLKNLTLVGAIGENANMEFLETAIELKEPHKILHYLGKNLEEAERITRLPAKKMAMEMARIEAQLNAPTPAVVTPISNAPAPVVPVGGTAKAPTGDINDPNITSAQWYALRAKQVEERKKRYQ